MPASPIRMAEDQGRVLARCQVIALRHHEPIIVTLHQDRITVMSPRDKTIDTLPQDGPIAMYRRGQFIALLHRATTIGQSTESVILDVIE